jgi:hypothetical protein
MLMMMVFHLTLYYWVVELEFAIFLHVNQFNFQISWIGPDSWICLHRIADKTSFKFDFEPTEARLGIRPQAGQHRKQIGWREQTSALAPGPIVSTISDSRKTAL